MVKEKYVETVEFREITRMRTQVVRGTCTRLSQPLFRETYMYIWLKEHKVGLDNAACLCLPCAKESETATKGLHLNG